MIYAYRALQIGVVKHALHRDKQHYVDYAEKTL